jgi:hypothetical protein
MNYSLVASLLLLALASPPAPAHAFQSPNKSIAAPSSATSLRNALRDMAAFPDDMKMMSEFEAFDRNGAFSRSPQQGGGYGGMMGGGGNANGPFAHRGRGERGGRSLDGFDPHSAYGDSYGMSHGDVMRGGGGGGMDYGMDYYGPPDMMMMMGRGGGMGMGMMNNNVRDTNTMGGFSYSSRVRDYAGYDRGMGGGGGGMGGFDGPMMMGGGFDGPMMGGGEMEYDPMYDQQQQQRGGGYGGGYGGLGDMSRMGP